MKAKPLIVIVAVVAFVAYVLWQRKKNQLPKGLSGYSDDQLDEIYFGGKPIVTGDFRFFNPATFGKS